MNSCPVKDCTAKAKPGHLMCLAHWHNVPRKLQIAVNKTWARYRYEPEAYREARAEAIRAAEEAGSPEGMLL